jgi:hypothetical protein
MSEGLSERIQKYNDDGNHFTDDSIPSEKTLKDAIHVIKDYVISLKKGTLIIKDKMTVFDLKMIQKNIFSDAPEPNESDKKKYISPDGGIWFLLIDGKEHPILIIEDKKQGTNDLRFSDGKGKQGLGNAIERFAKNVRACEMLFHEYSYFPYLLFASGCDFHPSETISHRIVVGNYGYPNHEITLTKDKTQDELSNELDTINRNIDVKKKLGNKCIVQTFVKSHRWNEMNHNSSSWTKNEIINICCKTIDLVIQELL